MIFILDLLFVCNAHTIIIFMVVVLNNSRRAVHNCHTGCPHCTQNCSVFSISIIISNTKGRDGMACIAYHAKHTRHSRPGTAYRRQHTMHSMSRTAYQVQHTMHSTPGIPYHAQHTSHCMPGIDYHAYHAQRTMHTSMHAQERAMHSIPGRPAVKSTQSCKLAEFFSTRTGAHTDMSRNQQDVQTPRAYQHALINDIQHAQI